MLLRASARGKGELEKFKDYKYVGTPSMPVWRVGLSDDSQVCKYDKYAISKTSAAAKCH